MEEWTDEEDQLLAEAWGDRSPLEIASALWGRLNRSRSPRAITVRASRLGLSSLPVVPPEDEDLIVALVEERHRLRDQLASLTDSAIAEKFEVPTSTVVRIRRSMRED